MLTLILPFCGSLLGWPGIIAGIAAGVMVDQAFLLWIWERQLEGFLIHGKPLRWLRSLAPGILLMRWWVCSVERQAPGSMHLQETLGNGSMVRVLGRWGLVPGMAHVTRSVFIRLASGDSGLWTGAGTLTLGEGQWVLGRLLELVQGETGMNVMYGEDILSLGSALGMSGRDFKKTLGMISLIPPVMVERMGIEGLGAISDLESVRIYRERMSPDMYRSLWMWVEQETGKRDLLVDEYATRTLG